MWAEGNKMYVNSNMTPREAFNQFGTLPESMIDSLINTQEAADQTSGVCPNIEETLTQYPGEDFIESAGVFDDLRAIARSVRGDNKAAILNVIEKLEALQLCIARQSEYGKSELNNALNDIAHVMKW